MALDPDDVETNIVVFDLGEAGMSATDFADRVLAEHGVRFSVLGPTVVRAVTHLDVGKEDVESAVAAAATVLGS